MCSLLPCSWLRRQHIQGAADWTRRFLAAGLPVCAALLLSSSAPSVHAQGVDLSDMAPFDPALLRFPVDVHQYAQADTILPGTYRVDLHLNGQWKGRMDVRFAPEGEGDAVQPCFDRRLLDTLGFDLERLRPNAQSLAQDEGVSLCISMAELFEATRTDYDHTALRLNVSAPQSVLRRSARGYVDPSLWDAGVTAATLQYRYNGWYRQSFGNEQTSHYLNYNAGVNAGAWRLRYSAAATHTSGHGSQYRSNVLYAERAWPEMDGRLVAGQTFTDGQIFSPLVFTGLLLESDERMRPDSQRGFAPVIRGIAQTNARVRITQLGALLYETTVPPGSFVIEDLYPTGSSGDLLVTITETDGSEHRFTVDYTGMVALVRPGVTHYALALGRSRDRSLRDKPKLVQATVRHGFSNTLTGYGGIMLADSYRAVAAGVALNLPVGAVTADLTWARTARPVESGAYQGYSARVAWSKRLPVTDTQVALAAYRYSSSDYYEPDAAFALSNIGASGQRAQRRNRLSLSLNQNLPNRLGRLSMTAGSQDYWQRSGRDTQYQVAYSFVVESLTVGLSASRTRNVSLDTWENQYMLNLSAPVGGAAHPMHFNNQHIFRDNSQAAQIGLAAVFGDDRQFSTNVYSTRDDMGNHPVQYGGGAAVTWTAPQFTLGATVSESRNNRQVGVSASGGVVVLDDGVVFSNALGDTVAVVQAKDAAGARVMSRSGLKLDRDGLAVVPYMRPYRQNEVKIDPKGLSADVSLASTSQQVVPTAGAVAVLRYDTQRSYAILIQGKRSDGKPLPFAATVLDEEGQPVGHVGQAGQMLVRVAQTAGVLSVHWGQGREQRCTLVYAVSAELPPGEKLRRTDAVCAWERQEVARAH